LPIAKIIARKHNAPLDSIQISYPTSETGKSHLSVTGPAPLTLANSAYPTATATVPGEYN
jgi:hypothetical protein